MKSIIIRAACILVLACPVFATTYYASPDGSSSGNGSRQNPWDLTTALAKRTPVGAGDELHLLEGEYTNGQSGPFRSYAEGSSSQPVIVRPAPGAEVVIDGGFEILRGDAVFRDLHVTSLNPLRQTSASGSWPKGLRMQEGFDVHAPRVKIINNRIHDVRLGVSAWRTAPDTIIYGNIIYYTGWLAPDRPHGTAFYVQNDHGFKLVKDNIAFNSFRHGLQAFGTSGSALHNVTVEGNIAFNNGALANAFSRNYLLGGGRPAERPVFRSNYSYYPLTSGTGDNNIGYWPSGSGCKNLVFEDNYFASGGRALALHKCTTASFRGNTVVGNLIGLTPGQFPGNTFRAKSNPPSGVKVVVRPNQYEKGRAHIVIYNWDRRNTVAVDLSQAGLRPGDRYELINVQNFEYGRLTGVYGGGAVQVSMTNRTVGQPHNWSTPSSTFPVFGVFLVRKAGGGDDDEPTSPGPPPPPPPTVDTEPPTISLTNPRFGQTVSGTVNIQAQASDDEGVAQVQFEIDGSPLGSPDRSAPYALSWNTKSVADGVYSITATATDDAGNQRRSTAVSVQVKNAQPSTTPPPPQPTPPGTDQQAPVARIVTPGSNETFSEQMNVVVNASDDRGVAYVRVMVDGRTITRLYQAPYQTSIDVSGLSVGAHSLRAFAEDTSGKRSRVHSITFRVDRNAEPPPPPQPTVDRQKPTVNITRPGTGWRLVGDVTVTAVAGDNVGVTSVQFELNGQPLGAPDTRAPYSFAWSTTSVANGTYQLTAKATDAAGNWRRSAPVSVRVENAEPEPPDGGTGSGGSGGGDVVLTLEAEDGVYTHPMKRRPDRAASGGLYIRSPTTVGTLTVRFRIDKAGQYMIWVRGRASDRNNDELYYSIDGGPQRTWGATTSNGSGWQWSPLQQPLNLSRGEHQIVFGGKGRNVFVDVLKVSNAAGFEPDSR